MYKSKFENFIFFEQNELIHLVKVYFSDVYMSSFMKNLKEQKAISNKLEVNQIYHEFKKNFFQKNFIEIIISITLSKFYNKFRIGFQVKNSIKIDDLSMNISKLLDLKLLIEAIEENTDCDFMFHKNNELIKFQLKQYKNKLSTDNLYEYIKDKVNDYKNLGNTNLIIYAQGDGSIEQCKEEVNIPKIYYKIKNLNYNFIGEILIMRCDKNYNFYIYKVYPVKRAYKKIILYKDFMTISQDIVKISLQKIPKK